MNERIAPLSNVVPYWENNMDGYPTKVRLAMSDGKIMTYRLEVIQPAPVLDYGWTNIGYTVQQAEYIGKHAKRPADAANIQPATEQKIRNNYIKESEL